MSRLQARLRQTEEPGPAANGVARILVVGAEHNIAQRRLLAAMTQRLRADGHDAVAWRMAEEGPARSVREADALVAVLDSLPADGAAAVALADALGRPCLGLATRGQAAPIFAELTRLVEGDDEAAWWAALPGFYDHIRPFAGRLVRDRIPALVREAGHDVQFRRLRPEERPRFLKQKVATEAKELLAADVANEKEEVADVLEALEAFILARGFDRDDLRRIKEHKKKQRGGFEQAYVVEATGGPPADAPAEDHARAPAPALDNPARPSAPAENGHTRAADGGSAQPRGGTAHDSSFGVAERAAQQGVATGSAVDYEYTDATPLPPAEVDDVGPGRDVRAKFFEI